MRNEREEWKGWLDASRGIALINCVYSRTKIRIGPLAADFCPFNPFHLSSLGGFDCSWRRLDKLG